jgi:TrmH family RNA methyltransferase
VFVKNITSPGNPFYKELHRLSSSTRHRSKAGKTLLDGAHLLSSYLASGKQPLHVIINETAMLDPEISSLLKLLPDVPVTQFDGALFAELSELKTVSGVLALIAMPQDEIAVQNKHFCLLLENIQDPGNLGSMLRSAAAAGCDAVYLSRGCADAWSPRVLRTAMGGHFVLNIYEHADLISVAALFGGTIFAAALGAKNKLYDSRLTGNIAFAIGNEGAGLSTELTDKASPVAIPMPGKVESLNAAAAAAICLFEAVRQRSII